MAKVNHGIKTVKIVLRFFGLAFLIGGGVLTYLTNDFMNNALPATGNVVSVEVSYNDDSVTYRPTIRFTDYAGRKQRGQTFMSSSSYNFGIGSKVHILYNVENPENLRMDTWIATWGFGIILIAASIVPFGIASFIGRIGSRNTVNRRSRIPRTTRFIDPEEEEMIEISSKIKGLVSRESRSDHERETNYIPTVRRNR